MDDAFNAALALLAAAADARGCKNRLKKLRLQERRTTAALAKLDAAREKHAATKAELAAKEAALKVREEACVEAEHEYRAHLPRERYPLSANGEPGTTFFTGMARHGGDQ
jgi:hypothetical protein